MYVLLSEKYQNPILMMAEEHFFFLGLTSPFNNINWLKKNKNKICKWMVMSYPFQNLKTNHHSKILIFVLVEINNYRGKSLAQSS